MEDEHERIVDVTTPNFNGYVLTLNLHVTVHKSISGTSENYMEISESGWDSTYDEIV